MEQETSDLGMKLNEQAIDALRESAKWSFFLSIIGFIGIAFMLIAAVFISAVFPSGGFPGGGGMMAGNFKGIMTGMYILLSIFYFFPVYYLFKYGTDMKSALQNDNPELLSNALVYLKSHHKFLGMMTIIMISLYILFIIGAVIYGVSASHM